MCGFAGYLKTPGDAPPPDSVLTRMTDSIIHRGPDGFGYFHDQFVALGHRRLSIIDLNGGAQPMYSPDRKAVIVYNGEVYNHGDLRPALEAGGCVYSSHCDTETILHAYRHYGTGCVELFRGMFSFAIWDSSRQSLFLARDRLGIKPLYYWFDGRQFVFGSEIKALLRHPAVSARADQSMIAEYLAFGYLENDSTLFAGVRQLPPGHTMSVRWSGDGWNVATHRFWDIPTAAAQHGEDTELRLSQECRRLVEQSVQLRLMSDVPLGMFLSGGVDSSVIAAVMKRLRDEPVETFSVGYSEAAYSELQFARDVSEHIGSKHHEVTVSKDEFFAALPRLTYQEDEPITWPSSIPLYFVSRLAASRVKVVLTGEGADELFAGYARYRHYLRDAKLASAYGIVPQALRSFARRRIESTSLLTGSVRRKLGHTVLGRESGIESLYLDNYYCAFPQGEVKSLLLKTAQGDGNVYDNYLKHWGRDQPTLLSRLLHADQRGYLPELLRKQDRMSMAASIESRVPMLDHHLVEFSTTVPDEMKIRGREGKYIFKKAMGSLLPARLIYRKKMGFPTPLVEWLSGASGAGVVQRLQDSNGLLASLVDRQALEGLINAHQSGRIDATDRLWRLLTIQTWGDVFLLGKYPAEGPEPLR